MSTKSFFILSLFLLFVLGSCKREIILPSPKLINKTVLVYMDANNDLKYYALNCINQMEKGALNIDGVMLVYIKTEDKYSYLLKIKYDSDENKIVSDTVKTFINENPSDPGFMKEVLHFSQQQYPATSSGLILWSHATSWAPPVNAQPKTKAFGMDRGKEMDIIEMRDAIPDHLQFIIFDACNMGSLEVLFEFKDKADYIIASPSEIVAESYPYQFITQDLFKGPDQLRDVAKGYFNYYNAYSDERRSATVSLFKTAELTLLAQEMKSLIRKEKIFGDIFSSSGVHRMDFSSNFPVPVYDFADFLNTNFENSDLSQVLYQLNKTILYTANTPSFVGNPIANYCGVTCYIPGPVDMNLSYYKRLRWYKDSGFYTLFEK